MDFSAIKIFLDSLTQWRMPGNAVVIYKDGKKAFEYQSGYADLENKIPMTADHMINIHSCSKVATVVAALQLYEQGRFNLTDPLYDYIPEFRDMYIKKENDKLIKAKNPITIKNLFTMTAGFDYNLDIPAFDKARKLTSGNMNTVEAIKSFAQAPICFEPGTRWQYSLCHDVLGAFIEVVSGKLFRDYVKENIFDKLEMTDSYYHITPEIQKRMAQQYLYDVSQKDIVELQKSKQMQTGVLRNVGLTVSDRLGCEFDSGGAGIVTSVKDYAKFTAALANKGVGITGERILKSSTIDLLKTNHLSQEIMADFNWPQLKGYGYGLGVRTMIDKSVSGSLSSIGEFGWGGAAGATVLVDTDLNLSMFYAHHMLNPHEEYYQPRLRDTLYSCIKNPTTT